MTEEFIVSFASLGLAPASSKLATANLLFASILRFVPSYLRFFGISLYMVFINTSLKKFHIKEYAKKAKKASKNAANY